LNLRQIGTALCFLCITALFKGANAQDPPPPPPPPGWIISVDAKLKGLVVNTSANPPAGVPFIEDHETVFSLSLDPVNGAPNPSEYNWHVARDEIVSGQPPPANSLIVDGSGHARTATGRAWAPGIFTVSCTFSLANGDGTFTEMTQSRNVAVFGGPLSFVVDGGNVHSSSGVTTIPDRTPHNNQTPKSPWYRQFFGTDPVDPNYDEWEQHPQFVWVAMPEQPPGATVSFTYPGCVVNLLPASWEILELHGVSPAQSQPVRATVQMTFEDATLSVMDTTEGLPNKTGLISVHQPGAGQMVVQQTTPGIWTGGLTTADGAKRHDVMKLKDTLGNPMSGVAVQERFTALPPSPYVPPGWSINVSGSGWIARLARTASYPLFAPGWPDHGQTMSITTQKGDLNSFDNLCLIWVQGDTQVVRAIHEYWAGTWNTTAGAHGTNLGAFNITFRVGTNFGDRGTVQHAP
jgi:hypothetical protein